MSSLMLPSKLCETILSNEPVELLINEPELSRIPKFYFYNRNTI